jgi:hypothetical protein
MLNNKQFKLLLENIQFKEKIKILLNKYHIKNYTINDDDSVDIDGDVDLSDMSLIELPFKFGKIKGHFICFNSQLINLVGAPQIVKGNFDCSSNQLTNLKGAPQIVEGDFDCSNNKLINLNDAPKILIRGFWLFNSEWEYLNPLKPKQEITLDNITDTYGEDEFINIKNKLYKDNRLIKR